MSTDISNARNTDIWIAGAFAAFTVDLLVYPLDTIKTRLQSPDYKRLYTNGVDSKVSRSMFRGVYQGVGSVIIATLPSCKNRVTLIDVAGKRLTGLRAKQEHSLPHTRASSPSSRTTILHLAIHICLCSLSSILLPLRPQS